MIDPEILERLRRGVPLRMSSSGELRFGDEPVTHARVRQALRSGLDLSDQGEPIVRLGDQWCYLTIDDCPLRATAVLRHDDELHMRLDDGRELPLRLDTLWDEPRRGLRAQAPSQSSGRPLAVRFTNQAQMDLAEWLDAGEDDEAVLVLGSRRWVVPREPPHPNP